MLQYQTVEDSTLGLLKALASKDYMKQFALVGGTALALQLGHRKSVDLDFFTIEDFDANILYEYLAEDFNITQVTVKLRQTLILEIDYVKVDCIGFKHPFIRPIHSIEDIQILDIEDIAPMKLDALSARGAKKDFYDIYFLLQRYSLSQLLDFYREKYEHDTIFHVIRSLTYFEDAEEDADPIVFDSAITWESVKRGIEKAVVSL